MIKAVLFDFDGTLVDSLSFHLETYEIALASCGIQKDSKYIAENCFGRTIKDTCQFLGIPEKYEVFNTSYEAAVNKLKYFIPLFDETEYILTHLKGKKYNLSLISFAYKWYLVEMLQKKNIDSYFDIVLGQEDVTFPKPHPEAIHYILNKLQIRPEEAIMIGDSKSDILMAKKAGCKSVLIFPDKYSKFYDLTDLKTTNPDYIIQNLSELSKLL